MEKYTGFEIAVIGASGRFPGAKDIETFWDNIKSGTESIGFFSDEELLEEGIDPQELKNPAFVNANGYVENKQYFDSAFFNYRPSEATLMDPQMRFLHEYVWKAIESAGYDVNTYKGKIGLFSGAGTNLNWQNYAALLNGQEQLVDTYSLSLLSNVAFNNTRISYLLNLRGPSIAVNTACSTSLVAVHQACNSLLLGECSMALAGGVKINNYSKVGYLYEEGMISSPDGHCRPYDKDAGGTIGGEGIGLVVLKRLKKAIADDDNILAVIKGTGINNDGHDKVGYTAPSVNGQTEAILMAQKMAKVEPQSISYVEGHGTATHLGDPIEVEALNRAFGSSREKYCALGSVKSNIGHLDTAAGIAGLIKTVMAIKERKLPPTIHFKSPNPKINFADTPFYVNAELKEWNKNGTFPLRAGVSSFGIGGTNAHIILEEPPSYEEAAPVSGAQLYVWSAKTPSALKRMLLKFHAFIEQGSHAPLANIAYTLKKGRATFRYRTAIACENRDELLKFLDPKKGAPKDIGLVKGKNKPEVIFTFSGQGSQYVNMCRGLYGKNNVFTQELNNCFEIAKSVSEIDWKAVIFPEEKEFDSEKINRTEYAQPLLFMIEYAIARQLIALGIHPDKMIGHSIGEYVAACISSVFTLEDALTLVVKRGQLMQQAQPGKMLSISATEAELKPLIEKHEEVSLAAINSTRFCVVSGKETSIEAFQKFLEEAGYSNKLIPTSHAFHSYMMDEVLDEFEKTFEGVNIQSPQIPFVSNLTGKLVTDQEACQPGYWSRHLRQPVLFSNGLELLLEEKEAMFIEIGPGNALSTFVRTHKLRKKEHKILNTVRHPREEANDDCYFLSTIGELWENGVEASWDTFYENQQYRRAWLPTYAFDLIEYPAIVDSFKLISKLTSAQDGDIKFELSGVGKKDSSINNDDLLDAPLDEVVISPLELELKALWETFFGKSNILVDDEFLEIGGDSLSALNLIGKIHKEFNVTIPLVEFFKDATIGGLGRYIESQRQLIRREDKHGEFNSIQKAPKRKRYALSSAQRRMYFLHEFDRASLAYNMPQVVRLEGALDEVRLHQAFTKLIQRHESLRTSFEVIDDEVFQKIQRDVDFEIECFKSTEEDVPAVIKGFIRPFDLSKGPLIRVGLAELTSQSHILMVDLHHIITDGTSQGILTRDFMKLYNQEEAPEIALQYKDYAEWQQTQEQQAALTKDKEFWVNQYADEVHAVDLPTDFSRPKVKNNQGATLGFTINKSRTSKLKSIGEQEGATMFMSLLAIFNILLSKLSNQEDIVVGTPVAGRNHTDLMGMMGMFVNTLTLRNEVKDDLPFRAFLASVKEKTFSCFDHQSYQYEELIDELNIARDTSRNPLFDVMFSFMNFEVGELTIPGLTLKPYSNGHNISKFDLTLNAVETDDQIQLNFEYSTSLFKQETIERFINYFNRILDQVIENDQGLISELHLLSLDEVNQLIEEFNDTAVDYDRNRTIIDLFEDQVQKRPKETALICKGQEMTYLDFQQKVDQMASFLIEKGVNSESIIGILGNRSFDIMVGIFGVLKSGAAFLPIDPGYPEARIEHIIKDSKVNLLLVSPEYAGRTMGAVEFLNMESMVGSSSIHTPVPNRATAGGLAYVIYTSGSTGNPKGVQITHAAALNFVQGISEKIDFNEKSRVLGITTISFDIFFLEMLLPLTQGASVVIATEQEQNDPESLQQIFEQTGINMIQFTPSRLKSMLLLDEELKSLKGVNTLMVGGEAFPENLLKMVQKVFAGRIFNMYGPTETTIWSTICDLTLADRVTIGNPIANTTIYVLSSSQQVQPVDVPGEMYIGGEGLSCGYLNNEGLTKEKFVDNPFKKGDKLYRTGDLVRWTEKGELEFLGRSDHQVKVRGFRIELEEIEGQLLSHPKISECLVVAHDLAEDRYLVAYYVAQGNLPSTELRNFLSQTLPAFMLPAYFVPLEKVPLTPNGKINRNALPEPELVATENYVSPSTNTEKELEAIWISVLNHKGKNIGIHTNFFEIGGHSLRAMSMLNKIRKQFMIMIPLPDFFQRPTIADLNKMILLSKVTLDKNKKDKAEEPSYKL